MSTTTLLPEADDQLEWLGRIESLLQHGSDQALFAVDTAGRIIAWRADTGGALGYHYGSVADRHLRELFPDYEAEAVAELLSGAASMASRRLVMRTARGTFAAVDLRLDGSAAAQAIRLGSLHSVIEQQEIQGLVDTGKRMLHELEQRRTVERQEWDLRVRGIVAEFAHTVKELKSAKDEARAIVDTAHDAFVAIDSASVILEWNRQAEQTFGWSRADAVGRSLMDTIIPPQHREAHMNGIVRFLASGEGPLLNRRIEVPALHREGYQFPVEMTIWPSEHSQGRRFNAFLHDISERKLEEQRTAARYAAACALVEHADARAAQQRLLGEICQSLGWALGVFWRIDDDAGVLRMEGFHARDDAAKAFMHDAGDLVLKRGEGLPGKVWASGSALWLDDFPSEALPRTGAAAARGLHGAFAFPVGDDGHSIGVIEFFSAKVEPPDERLLAMMRDIGRLLGRASTRWEGA